jgi:hypothetical protein
MITLLDLLLLIAAISLSLTSSSTFHKRFSERVPKDRTVITAFIVSVFVSCLLVDVLIHEPIPRIHDEFSYTLLGDTLAHWRVANQSPPLPEFFDTFHVLIRPVYSSKYFPAQGMFLAFGEKLTGHQAVGIWLSSALACGAGVWMLQAWVGSRWAILGGILMALQYGIFSYWSQSYWGGMPAAFGGCLFFGAARRLWDSVSWQSSSWAAVGLVIIANSRPTEGFFAVLPVTGFLIRKIWTSQSWREASLWQRVVLPAGLVLIAAAAAMGVYNRSITGLAWKPPYVLHEQQYQESPQFTFLPLRPKITYSSFWVQCYYEVNEMRLYLSQRTAKNLLLTAAMKFEEWWEFYCGILLSTPLVLPGLLVRKSRYWQATLLFGFVLTAIFFQPRSELLRFVIDVLAVAQIAIIWVVFDEFWERLALATIVLILFESWFVKWGRPHYFAPAACLVLFLQIEGLRRLWNWKKEPSVTRLNRSERRRIARLEYNGNSQPVLWKNFVVVLPLACAMALALRIFGRVNDWWFNERGPTHHVLMIHDWSVRRAELEKWLQTQSSPQLVFVQYSANHNVNFEWVYNHADIMHSHVIWARDLGNEHNKQLLELLPDRTVWLVRADKERQLVPYSQVENQTQAPRASPEQPGLAAMEREELNW